MTTVHPSSNLFCSAKDTTRLILFASIAGYCFKIELIDNDEKLIGDHAHPTYATKSGTGVLFSNLGDFSGNTAC